MEFAHNARSHSATGISPFQAWYGYQLQFIPFVKFTTVNPTVEEQLHLLEQICSKVTASLQVAAEIMKCSGSNTPMHKFKENNMVWLEGVEGSRHT